MVLVEFDGVWISDAFGKMTLTQQEQTVCGVYIGRGGGSLQGSITNERLNFSWQDQADTGMMGWGFLRAISGGRTLTGFWGYADDRQHRESIIAELLTRGDTSVPSGANSQDAMEMKFTGYNLANQGKYDQALPLLESALKEYQYRFQQEEKKEHSIGGSIVDIVHIITYLLMCYFFLADYQSVSYSNAMVQQREVFYTNLLAHLHTATIAYQDLLGATIRQRIRNPLNVLTRSMDVLRNWQEQLRSQTERLGQQEMQDLLITRMNTLADLLNTCYEHQSVAQRYLTTLHFQVIRKPSMISETLTDLEQYLEAVQRQAISDIEQLRVHGKEWSEPQHTFVLQLSQYLEILQVELQGERRHIALAKSWAQSGLEKVLNTALNLSNWLERWRVRLAQDIERMDAQERGQPFFSKFIQFFVELDRGGDALVLSEQARARAFIDLLATRAALREGLSARATEQSGINVPAVTMDELQAIVQRRHCVTIEYFVTTENVLIWVISAHGDIATFVSPIGQDKLKAIIQSLLQLFQREKLEREQRAMVSQLLQDLYRYLLAPIPRELLPTAAEETLTIIPHDILLLVPFAALRENASTHFIQQHALCYAPSLHLLKYMHINKQHCIHTENPNLLALVNPEPFPDPSQPSLMFTEQAFGVIEAFYAHSEHNTILKGKDASKKTLRQKAAQHTVLYFATHAQAFDDDPLASYLALACIPPEEDGYLRVPEIFQLDLHTDLVVLLACETGRGKVTGDGMNGLSRAFIGAGTPSLLMSLWPIPEQESFNQIYLFYEYWQTEHHSKAQALRLAQLEILEDHPEEPAIWSVFALLGE